MFRKQQRSQVPSFRKLIPPGTVVALGVLLLQRLFLDADNEVHLWIVRGIFGVAQCALIGTVLYLLLKIRQNNEGGTVTVAVQGFAEEEHHYTKMTPQEYDKKELQSLVLKTAFGIAIVLFVHFRWGFFPPLLIHSFVSPMTIYNHPLFKLYVQGQRPFGKLKRPWEDPTETFTNQLSSRFLGVDAGPKTVKGRPKGAERKQIKKRLN